MVDLRSFVCLTPPELIDCPASVALLGDSGRRTYIRASESAIALNSSWSIAISDWYDIRSKASGSILNSSELLCIRRTTSVGTSENFLLRSSGFLDLTATCCNSGSDLAADSVSYFRAACSVLILSMNISFLESSLKSIIASMIFLRDSIWSW